MVRARPCCWSISRALPRLFAGAAAVITFHGAARSPEGDERPVRVVGRLDYGFRIDAGVASILRIEQAAIELLETQA